jgi:hypothetical protein
MGVTITISFGDDNMGAYVRSDAAAVKVDRLGNVTQRRRRRLPAMPALCKRRRAPRSGQR